MDSKYIPTPIEIYETRSDEQYLSPFDPSKGIIEKYTINSKHYHREDGPACISYHNRKVIQEEFFLYGVRHRIDGPAVIKYNPNGTIANQYYWLNGYSLTQFEFLIIMLNDTLEKYNLYVKDNYEVFYNGKHIMASDEQNLENDLKALLELDIF